MAINMNSMEPRFSLVQIVTYQQRLDHDARDVYNNGTKTDHRKHRGSRGNSGKVKDGRGFIEGKKPPFGLLDIGNRKQLKLV